MCLGLGIVPMTISKTATKVEPRALCGNDDADAPCGNDYVLTCKL